MSAREDVRSSKRQHRVQWIIIITIILFPWTSHEAKRNRLANEIDETKNRRQLLFERPSEISLKVRRALLDAKRRAQNKLLITRIQIRKHDISRRLLLNSVTKLCRQNYQTNNRSSTVEVGLIRRRRRRRRNAVDLPATTGPARPKRYVREQNIVSNRRHPESWNGTAAFPSSASSSTSDVQPRGAASAVSTVRQFIARLPICTAHSDVFPRPTFRQHRDGGWSGPRSYWTRGLEALPSTEGTNSEWYHLQTFSSSCSTLIIVDHIHAHHLFRHWKYQNDRLCVFRFCNYLKDTSVLYFLIKRLTLCFIKLERTLCLPSFRSLLIVRL